MIYWWTDDPVYLDSEDLRREYLMNETGKVFVGTHNRPKGRRWVYGQFSDAFFIHEFILR